MFLEGYVPRCTIGFATATKRGLDRREIEPIKKVDLIAIASGADLHWGDMATEGSKTPRRHGGWLNANASVGERRSLRRAVSGCSSF
jgi:hypothetical protein